MAMASFPDGTNTPSLAHSNNGSEDSHSDPATPSDQSPNLSGQAYAIPSAMEPAALPPRHGTPQQSFHAALPHILDPATAANMSIRRVCCIGAGYVGGPTAAVIALHNPDVRVAVVDRDVSRINAWKGRHLPIDEPGLGDVVRLARDGGSARLGNKRDSARAVGGALDENMKPLPVQDMGLASHGRQPNLFFSTACIEEIARADMVLISVNTPTKRCGVGAGRATDMTAIEGATKDVAMHARPGTIIVEKSTVPCQTGQLIKDIVEQHRPGVVFPVLSNPEFLSEGTAIRDLMTPDRVVIGCESTLPGHRAAAALANLYAAWVPRARISPINIWSSELCKLVANAMLAQRVSSINSVSAICERTGADVGEIAKCVGQDARIGSQFLKAGLGFGGSCFRKDIASLTYLAESLGLPEVAESWNQVLVMNNFQRDRFARQVIATLNNSLRGKKITILGYAFKKDTGDARESPALDVVRLLLEEGPRSIAIFDPLCREADIKRELSVLEGELAVAKPDGPVEIMADPYEACADSNAVLVLTDWDMFKNSRISTAASKSVQIPNPLDSNATSEVIYLASNTNGALPNQPAQTLTSLPPELAAQLMPEPACPVNCAECKNADTGGETMEKDTTTPLNWNTVASAIKEPRWVFDGRGVLDTRTMVSLGFRLETLGRASLY